MHPLRDARLIFIRSIKPTLRKPSVIIMGASQPLLSLIFFGPLLDGGIAGETWQWYVPGLVIEMALLGTSYAGYALMPEIRTGVLERLLVTPISRVSLLLGRVARDVCILIVQCVILLAMSTVFGFRASPTQFAAILIFGVLTGVAIAAASHALALKVKHEYVFGPLLGTTVMPLLLLSGALLPMDKGPRWLWLLSRINPLSYAVDGARSVVDPGIGSAGFVGGGLVTLIVSVACLSWGVYTFQQENG